MDDIRQHIEYTPETGRFFWLTSGRRRKKGDRAGAANHCAGYVRVGFRGKIYLAHRLAWWFVHGEWPPGALNIDHINGDKTDNRIANLRLCDQTGNNGNKAAAAKNVTGFKGVRKHSQANVWIAQITKAGRPHHIGTYPTAADAARAYDAAAREHFGEFARLNFPEVSHAR